jgi:hypothetical protein
LRGTIPSGLKKLWDVRMKNFNVTWGMGDTRLFEGNCPVRVNVYEGTRVNVYLFIESTFRRW